MYNMTTVDNCKRYNTGVEKKKPGSTSPITFPGLFCWRAKLEKGRSGPLGVEIVSNCTPQCFVISPLMDSCQFKPKS